MANVITQLKKLTMRNLTVLFVTALLFWSCSNLEETTLELENVIEYKVLDHKVTPDNNVKINLSDTDHLIILFEIIELEIGYASRAKPGVSVQILDSSTYGYCDALELRKSIGEENIWSDKTNFVLGTSVGNGGQFEGNGLKYLGFRVQVDDDYQYGWVLVDNNNGNTCVELKSYAINTTAGKSILAGQRE